MSRRFGLIATNTIGQGDTREVALDALVARDCQIVRAERSRPWPGAAALEVAEVWCASKPTAEPCILGGQLVPGISPLLVPNSRVSGPALQLFANKNVAFIGSFVLGLGFLMTPYEAMEIVRNAEQNRDVLFPYITAEDICNRPEITAARWIINFHDWPEERAASYLACYSRIVSRVKPERQRRKVDGSFALRKPLPNRWWQYADKRPALYAKIKPLKSVVAMPLHSKYSLPVRLSTHFVFSHGLAVFAGDDDALYGLITSEIHQAWAHSRASTLETRFRYTPTDCFETFPLPKKYHTVDRIMMELHEHRARVMLTRVEGITATYNHIHTDSEQGETIRKIRELHVALDEAVLEGYGWSHIKLQHGFYDVLGGRRFTISEKARLQLLDSLLELNQQRYAAEVATGLHTKNGDANSRSTRGPTKDEPVFFNL